MSVPAAITTVIVTGKYVGADGQPLSGSVTFSPMFDRTVVATDDVTMLGTPVSATLDDSGAFAVTVAVGDDPDASPTGWGYSVVEQLRRADNVNVPVKSYTVALTSAMAPGPVDLSDLVPGTGSATAGAVAALPVTGGTLLGALTVPGGPVVPAESANVRQFGALGHNAGDDTAAIQAAINALPVGGGVVYFPTGTYRISSALVLASGVNLVGDGDDTIIIKQTSTSANCLQGDGLERIGLRSLQLLGPGSGTGHGLALTKGAAGHVAYVALENITAGGFGGDGVRIENPIVSTLSRVVANGNGGYGLNLYGQTGGAAGTSTTLSACYANGNGTAGVRLYNLVYSALSGCAADGNPVGYLIDTCQSVTLSGCGGESNTAATFKVNAGYGVTLAGAWVYDNRGIGVWITGSAGVATVIGAIDNSPNGTATAFIKVDSGCRVSLLNCNNTTANNLAAGTTNILSDAGGGVQVQGYAALLAGGECDSDLVFYASAKGPVLVDRGNGNHYRLRVSGGVLGIEAA